MTEHINSAAVAVRTYRVVIVNNDGIQGKRTVSADKNTAADTLDS